MSSYNEPSRTTEARPVGHRVVLAAIPHLDELSFNLNPTDAPPTYPVHPPGGAPPHPHHTTRTNPPRREGAGTCAPAGRRRCDVRAALASYAHLRIGPRQTAATSSAGYIYVRPD